MSKLTELITDYLSWLEKKEKAQQKLEHFKRLIILLAQEKKIKKIKAGEKTLYLISQSETRFPQIGDPGRKEVEKIVKRAKE